jgi:hypothetical protein
MPYEEVRANAAAMKKLHPTEEDTAADAAEHLMG